MKSMVTKYGLLIITLLIGSQVNGQDVKLTASAPKVVALGENFRLTYSANAEPDNFSPPEMQNIIILSGPHTSTSSSATFINGKFTQQVNISYTYIARAEKEGTLRIPPASIRVKNNTYQSNTLELEVIKGNNPQPSVTTPQTKVNTAGERFLIRLIPNKRTVYLGEHLIVTLKLYTQHSIRDVEKVELPPFTGFFKQDIENQGQVQLSREDVNGEIYYTGNYQQILLYPQKSGEITISPAKMDAILQEFRLFRASVESKPVTIEVKPLPPTQKKSFVGAVGDFTLDAQINKTNTVTNDAITLTITIKGNGNLRLIDDLSIPFPPSIESYDPKVSYDLRNTTGGTYGTKTYEYLLIPRHAGNYRIPPIEFTYFDPATDTYKTLTAQEFNLTIEKGDEAEGMVITGLSKEDVKFIGKDIQFIKQQLHNLRPTGYTFFGSWMFYSIYGTAVLLFVILTLFQRKRIQRNANVALVRNRKANKKALKRLKKAQEHLKKNEKEIFYEEMLKALWGYLSDKLSIPVSSLNHDNARDALRRQQIDEEIQEAFFTLINNCEFARYAPAGVDNQMEIDYKQAITVLTKLDQKIL